ncbi:MAG: Rieske 2Fe-2S domain-containing protein [Actinomycetota bacterium]|nr:Rieske 2Fe-2S domain-containing protein [Actinomycetota bacterium]
MASAHLGDEDVEVAEFVEVCAEGDLADGDKIAFEIDGRRVMLVRVEGRYYAIDSVCTHERAFLDEGMLVDHVVYCPLHYSCFDVRTGDVLGPPADKATATYAVRVENGMVQVSLQPGSADDLDDAGAADDVEVYPRERSATAHDRLVERVDSIGWLDGAAGGLARVTTTLRGRRATQVLMDLCHGRLAGHALHPALSDLPIGFWAGAVLLYLCALPWPAAVLTLAGIASAVAAMVTGFADLTVTDGHDRRVGIFHGILMTVALLIHVGSVVAFFAGSVPAAAVAAIVGFLVTVGGAYFGGHLVLGRAAMVDHTVWPTAAPGWQAAVRDAELEAGATAAADVGGRTVLLYRSPEDGHVSAIDNACSHAGGPLSLGKVCDGVVTCPWHDSRFRLRDGAALHGPATFAQPTFEVRVVDGWIEVRPAPG